MSERKSGKDRKKTFSFFSRATSPNTEQFYRLRKKFFDCSLTIGEHFGDPKTCYIDHYNDLRWKPSDCRVPLCRYDQTPPSSLRNSVLS